MPKKYPLKSRGMDSGIDQYGSAFSKLWRVEAWSLRYPDYPYDSDGGFDSLDAARTHALYFRSNEGMRIVVRCPDGSWMDIWEVWTDEE